LLIGALVGGLLASAPVTAQMAPQVKYNGRVEQIGGFRVLRVWGEPRDMGFAHGFLVGKEFVAGLPLMIKSLYGDNVAAYEATVASLKDFVVMSPASREEIEGIFEGIKRSHEGLPEIELLKRPLRVEDIVFFNSMDLLRAFACSGFAVWDKRAGDGEMIATRNFDYRAFSPELLSRQLIVVREPKGRHKVASVTWPGYIGSFTGINDDGVGIFLHDGSGKRAARPEQAYVPVALLAKEFLETFESRNVMRGVRNALIPRESPFSYIVRVVCSWRKATSNPAAVFHIDAEGIGFSPVKRDYSITTNHYLDDSFKPAGDAHEGSVRRYATLEKYVADPVTSETAWKALDAVAVGNPESGTLHALVLYPDERKLELAFATWDKEFVPATKNKPVTITFDELFGKAGTGDDR
jgi:hypothetical protein